MATERLQKILARAGYGSRRACESFIEEGRVTVDGKLAHLGDSADPQTQKIVVDGESIRYKPPVYTYIMLHKPQGVLSTVQDPHGRRTVLDLVRITDRVYPVGRLDYDSEGLILLTDDGDLAQQLTHPSYEHSRVYRALVSGEPPAEVLERWRRGIVLDGRPARFDKVEVESQLHDETWLRITVHEGRNHLVRRVAAALGHPVKRLIRVEMGPLKLGDLASGRWRHLTVSEVKIITGKRVGASGMRSQRHSSRTGTGRDSSHPEGQRGSSRDAYPPRKTLPMRKKR